MLFREIVFCSLIFTAVLLPHAGAQEIGFVEQYALAENRVDVLDRLVPGTEEYYYYHCLYYQAGEQFEKVEEYLKAWIKRFGRTQQVQLIQNRQALMRFGEKPDATYEYLKDKLSLRFAHQREIPSAERSLPTVLDPKKIDLAAFKRAAARGGGEVSGYSDLGLELVDAKALNQEKLRELLKRLIYPDYPDLVSLVIKDLEDKDSLGFGALQIHKNLTLEQLDACLKSRPKLIDNSLFVNAYLAKLLPGDDVNWIVDRVAYRDYLNRLFGFTGKLNPAFNSLKACVLYRILDLDRREGIYNRDRFVQYLKLPRKLGYVEPAMLKRVAREAHVNLSADYRQQTNLSPIHNDENLVRVYLHKFLVEAENYDAFGPYVRDRFLKREFATVKILNGVGDKEAWASSLSPAEYKALVNRVDLEFPATNKELFAADEVAEIELYTKNISKLIVKTYEINTFNYYRKYKREIDTDVNLDGLVPNSEETFSYDEQPALRKFRQFKFESLSDDGVYVIDFIGGGKSSRALVRRGQIFMVGRNSIAGHVFNVYDSNKKRVPKAKLWFAGNRYDSNEDGDIVVPYSTQPGYRSAIITVDGFSALQSFQHEQEKYELNAGIYVDRESLLVNQESQVILRPAVTVAGMPSSTKILKDCRLVIHSVDQSGNRSTKTLKDLQLKDDVETVCKFIVPARLISITFDLFAEVENISGNQTETLTASREYKLNVIDSTDEIQDVHLMPIESGHILEVRGRTGEERAGQGVLAEFTRRGFEGTISCELQSDKNGQIALGSLADITRLRVKTVGGSWREWQLTAGTVNSVQRLVGVFGDPLQVAVEGTMDKISRDRISLFEMRSGRIVADQFAQLKFINGVVIADGLQPGEYRLRFKETGSTTNISVIDGVTDVGVVMGGHRRAELRIRSPLVIESVKADDKSLKVLVGNASKFTRVHVLASRYAPRYDAFSELSRVRDVQPWSQQVVRRANAYTDGRQLSDEYRYILNRRYEDKYVGNMLERPSVLIRPWSVRDVENKIESLAEGDDFGDAGAAAPGQSNRQRDSMGWIGVYGDFANLDFIDGRSVLLVNKKLDDDGRLEIPLADLKGLTAIRVIAVDPLSTAQKQLNLPKTELKLRDLRLANALDPKGDFALAKQIDVLRKGDLLEIEDLLSSRYQQFDDLADVFRLFQSLNPGTELASFEFLLGWSELADEKKQELYSEYSCHELDYYLYQKDKTFFDKVVSSHVSYKAEQGIVDQFLTGQDLQQYVDSPWRFSKLNVLERILLSRKLEAHRPDVVRSLVDLFWSNPPKREELDKLYQRSVVSLDLDRAPNVAFESKSDAKGKLSYNLPALRGTRRKSQLLRSAGEFDELERSKNKKSGTVGDDDEDVSTRENNSLDRLKSLASNEHPQEFFRRLGDRLAARDKELERLFRRLPATREFIEQQYYKLPLDRQTPDRIRINRFWKDYAEFEGGSFLSPYFAECTGSFTEMMFALAVLDFPEKADEHEEEYDENSLQLTAGGPMVVLHQQFQAVEFKPQNTAVLISENFFQKNDRYRSEDGVRYDNFVAGKSSAHTLYGAQVVVTNPTSTPQAIDLLVQIPRGSVAVSGSQSTRSMQLQLDAYSTRTLEYFFYFPTAGEFTHYPAHVSAKGEVLAVADGVEFNVVDQVAEVDKTSWVYVSQKGSDDEVLEYLNTKSLHELDLTKIAFRMKEAGFFGRVIDVLRNRFIYDHTLWSYSIRHQNSELAAEYLENETRINGQVGLYLDSELLNIKPYGRNWYQHREYSPLINARIHQVGSTRKILNPALRNHYQLLLNVLSCKAKLSSDDRLAITYYLLVQDRISEAIEHFGLVEQDEINERIQYDYCDAYLHFCLADPDQAEKIATRWQDYPVDLWRNRFRNVLAQVAEIRGADAAVIDERANDQLQTKLAAEAKAFDFSIAENVIKLTSQALEEVEVNFYEMDIELMFSRSPFAEKALDRFSVITPTLSRTEKVSEPIAEIEIPEAFGNKNVLVELQAGDQIKSEAYLANSLNVQTIEKYGQLVVSQATDGKPLPKTYVKVYAMLNGQPKFHKDGYTDLRGRFDYVSQSNNPIDGVTQYAILVMSEEHGATTRQVAPPVE